MFLWSPPKPIPLLATFPSSSLLPMTGTNCNSHLSWRLTSPSLAISISSQSSLPITAPVHSLPVNSPPNYLIPTFLYICSFAPQYLYLHIYHSSVNAKLYFFSPLWPIYCLSTFAHTVYRFFYCVIDCTSVYPMCNSVLFVSHCFALSWPGRSCK
jgi:hypothetical protein